MQSFVKPKIAPSSLFWSNEPGSVFCNASVRIREAGGAKYIDQMLFTAYKVNSRRLFAGT
jgi:hypothetical protein